jgi:long-chain-fatty-acid--[acyl-carrier-protein] ligase
MRFADNLDNVPFDEIEHLLVFLEDLASEKITLKTKISAVLRSGKSADSLMKRYKLKGLSADDQAVILFTSGSEAAPKGVPLTHNNILSNIRSVQNIFKLQNDDVVYSFLPPFHSFGLTTTTILPLMLGLRVAHYPNPTEARKLANGIAKWKSTLIAGTPTFLDGIIKAARPGQLDTLRLMVTGAEKAPEELFEKVSGMSGDALLLEGYGITECSPVVSACHPGDKPVGVGKPIPGVELCIVDLDNRQPVPQGERGLILVNGPNIFHGYMGGNPPDPFCELNGKQWYNTGDLGFISDDGSLVISGRLKRFVKVGGEMVSLPAMESALYEKWPTGEDGPVVAVEAVERQGERPVISLFSSVPVTEDEANAVLRQAGFSNVVRVSRVDPVDKIPLLGTGKTDYRSLKKKLAELLGLQ